MNKLMGSKLGALVCALVLGVVMLPGVASAALTLPTADVVADVATASAFVAAIGAAVLGLIFLAKAFKWARRAG